MTRTTSPGFAAFAFRRSVNARSAAPSPPFTLYCDIFSLPGSSAVTSHVERLSSSDIAIVAASLWVAVWDGWSALNGIGRLLVERGLHTFSTSGRHPRSHRIFFHGRPLTASRLLAPRRSSPPAHHRHRPAT